MVEQAILALGRGHGNVFWSGTEVNPIGEPLLVSEAEAELWKPDESNDWTILIRSLQAEQRG